VTLTSIRDSSVGGNTIGEETTPSAGEWSGITVDSGNFTLTEPIASLNGIAIRYASVALSASGESIVSVHGAIENDNYGVQASTLTPVIATNVYWGSPSGPAPTGSGVGVSGDVEFNPWTA